MRRILFVLLAGLLVAAPSYGAVFQYSGQSTLTFSNLGRAEITDSGTGLATVNGSGPGGHLNTFTLTTGFATLDGVIPVTDPIVTAGGIVEVRVTSIKGITTPLPGNPNAGRFGPISGALQNTSLALSLNTAPVQGVVRLCLFVPGCGGASLVSDLSQTVNGTKNIGGGVGGVITIGAFGPIRLSILGAPWTIKTASVSNRTDNEGITFFAKNGWAHGPASLTSSTAVTSGVFQLVNASQTTTTGIPGNSDKSGNVTHQVIHFIPEPGLLLLLGVGAVGVAALGRKKLKR
jgi:hypothetical protein